MKDQWSLGSIAADGTHLEFIVSKLPCRIGRSKDDERLERLYYLEWQRSLTRQLDNGLTVDDT